jgi:hypothetical protein
MEHKQDRYQLTDRTERETSMNIKRHLLFVLLFIARCASFVNAQDTSPQGSPESLQFVDKLIAKRPAGVEFPEGTEPYFVFSPDKQHVAYLAKISANQQNSGQWVVVVDGVKSDAFDSLVDGRIRFSSDSKRVAYSIMRSGKTQIISDGKVVKELLGRIISLGFSSDLQHYACLVEDGGKTTALKDGEVLTGDFETLTEIALSGDGGHVLLAARNNAKREYVLLDNKRTGQDFEHITGIRFSQDGKQIGYSAEEKGQSFVAIGTKIVPVDPQFSLNHAWSLIFSDDGKRLLYAGWTVGMQRGIVGVVDQTSHVTYIVPGMVYGLIMSPENQTVFFTETRSRRVFLNGIAQTFSEGLIRDAAFSPSGKMYAFASEELNRYRLIAVHIGHGFPSRSQTYDYVSQPIFNPAESKVAFGVVQGDEFWLRTMMVN